MKFSKFSLLFMFVLMMAFPSLADTEFIVEDIRVQGLKRVSAGTVFNETTVEVGDIVDPVIVRSLLRELFAMGYFDDIQIVRDENVIEIVVTERPAIDSISIDGNKQIKSEDLLAGLADQGLREGAIFRQATLDRMRIELMRQYVGQGQYTADIQTTVNELPRNRVAIEIEIEEGKKSGISQIEFVGNQSYSKSTLLSALELKEPHLLGFLRGNNKYSRQRLQGDLETLQAFYRDQGYVSFRLRSTQISMTPDRKQVYVTIGLQEGDKYVIGEVDILGTFGDFEPDVLLNAIIIEPGSVFSSQEVTASEEKLTQILNTRGYTFAEVTGVPAIQDDGTVDVLFYVDSGKRVYVRRIVFVGNTVTQDSVLRREMRQLEGASASSYMIERSKDNLRRLGYFQNVEVETPAVGGSEDQIDVVFKVEERPTGSINGTLGYAEYSGLIVQGSFQQANIGGSGNSLAVAASVSDLEKGINFSYLDPYFTEDGISRALSINFSDISYNRVGSINRFSTSSFGSSAQFGVPIGDFKRLNLAGKVEWTDVTSGYNEAQQIADFVDNLGTKFLNYTLEGQWVYLGLNDALVFATRGSRHKLALTTALPGSELQYGKFDYEGDWFYPARKEADGTDSHDWVWHFRTRVGAGEVFGKTKIYPFFEHYYSGGYGSVRGYERFSLGPRSLPSGSALTYYPNGQPFGGNVVMEGSVELYFPLPFGQDLEDVRSAMFFDFGNVFSTSCAEDSSGCFSPSFGAMRYSLGLSVIFKSPAGLMGISLAYPFNNEDYDETERITFEILNTSF